MNATGTGIGRALKRAREVRGKTLEEASRETRIRAEYLQALEREAFDRLLGDVYVRGFLRSYAGYLGLDADKVLGVYTRTYGGHRATTPEPAVVPPSAAGNSEGHPLIHRRGNWGLAGALAAVVLVAVAVVALTSRSDDAPPAVPPVPSIQPSATPVVVELVALRPVDALVIVDGEVVFEDALARDEARSFEGNREVEVGLSDGEAVVVTVNGRRLGPVGEEGSPWSDTFGPDDFRGSPSPGV